MRSKSMLFCIILTIYCTCLFACSSQATNTFDSSVDDKSNINILNVGAQQIAYGFLDNSGVPINDNIIDIGTSDTFSTFLELGNFIDKEREYMILMFSNYEIVEFSVDGNKPSTSYNLKIPAQQDVQIPLTIENINEGYNDILVAIIKYPNANLSDEQRQNTTLNHILFTRCVVKRGNSCEFTPGRKCTLNTYSDAFDGIFLHEEEDEIIDIPHLSLSVNELKELYCTVGNATNEDNDYIVILLDNWKQVSINDNRFLYFSIPSNSHICLPINIGYDAIGTHEITALVVRNPYISDNIYTETTTQTIRMQVNVK